MNGGHRADAWGCVCVCVCGVVKDICRDSSEGVWEDISTLRGRGDQTGVSRQELARHG